MIDDLIKLINLGIITIDNIKSETIKAQVREKINAIQFLNDAGAFLITKAGDKIASFFGISKYSIYNYVDIKK